MNLERALHALCDAGVEFVVIGGVAATLHGSALVTFDLDICYSRTGANLKRLREALAPFHPRPRGFPTELPFFWDETTLRNNSILTLPAESGDIDLLAEVAGVGNYEQVKTASITINAFDRSVGVINLGALIRAKRAVGRPKDLAVIPELESLSEVDEEG